MEGEGGMGREAESARLKEAEMDILARMRALGAKEPLT